VDPGIVTSTTPLSFGYSIPRMRPSPSFFHITEDGTK
jgi:hypothetical protein